jgi:putative ABC transport system permease protein
MKFLYMALFAVSTLSALAAPKAHKAAAGKPSAEELLDVSDRARGGTLADKGLTWTTKVSSTENGLKTDVTYEVKVLGVNALAEVQDPPRQKGEAVLFNDRTLWFFKPGLRKPVNISPRQKLVGQAANGDIASTQYARDYTATAITEEKADGQDTWKLMLKAKEKNVTYDQIRYWISKKNKTAVRAEFLTLSGETFKIADFLYGNTLAKVPFVSAMKITDAKNPKNVTILTYKNPHEEAHSPGLFNVNSLMK